MASMGATPTRRPGAHTGGKEPTSSPPGRLVAGDGAQRVLKLNSCALLFPGSRLAVAGPPPPWPAMPKTQAGSLAGPRFPASLPPGPGRSVPAGPAPPPPGHDPAPLWGQDNDFADRVGAKGLRHCQHGPPGGVRGHGCWGTRCVSPQESQAWVPCV